MANDSDATGQAIFINGVQSAGKSTVADEFERQSSTFRIVSGDELIRRIPPALRHDAHERIFEHMLDTIRERLGAANVLVDSALTAGQIRKAKTRFGAAAIFVLLRVEEDDRVRREASRQDRTLAHEFKPEWHDLVGPDELYDIVLNSSSIKPAEAAGRIVDTARNRWSELTV